MAKTIGRLDNFGIGKESSRGTAVTPTIWVPAMDLDYNDKIKSVVNDASHGRLEASDGEVITGIYGEVTLKSKIKDTSFGYLLLSLMGTDTPVAKAGGNSAVYDHTFSVLQTTQHPSLTLALKGPNDDIAIPNAVVDSIKITGEVNKYVQFEAKAMGKASASASNTASYSAENDFFSKHITFKVAADQASLAAASAVTIRKFDLEIKSNAELEEVLGSTPINDVLNKAFEISGSVTITYTDHTYKALMLAGTYQALRFQLINTDKTIGASANPGLVIDLHRCFLEEDGVKRGMNDITEETFTFKAHYSLTDSKMITAVLTNLTASY